MGLYELFFEKIYTACKGGAIAVGGISAISLFVVASITNQPWLYVLGGIDSIQCLFLLFDESKVVQEVKREIENLKVENLEFQALNVRLSADIKTFVLENAKMKKNEENLKAEIAKLNAETEELNLLNDKMAGEVNKLKTLHDDSKKLLLKLMEAGDTFTHFNTIMSGNVDRLSDTSSDLQQVSNTMALLINALETQKFEDFDRNSDGVVNNDEWKRFFETNNK